MKKIALFVCTVLCANVLMAQVQFVIGDLTYSVINSNEVEVVSCVDSVDAVNIPATVTYNDVTYTYPVALENLPLLWHAAVSNGIDPVILISQAMIETGFFKFGGIIDWPYEVE